MKYFLHDSNSFNDEKITQLYIKFGYEGLGLFYTTLEKLSQQEKPMITEVLKHQLNIGKRLNKIWLFMESIDLISSNNGETFNKQLLNFSEKYQIKKQKNTERIAQWRKNQEDSENVTCNESVRNSPKVKESKVNRSKVKESGDTDVNNEVEIWPTFKDFWTAYNKKVGSKEKCKKKFDKLNQETKEIIMNHIFIYVKATPDKQYRLNPETFFNQKAWENEIINTNGKGKESTEAAKRTEYFKQHYPGYNKL
jgi:hypothetical protein